MLALVRLLLPAGVLAAALALALAPAAAATTYPSLIQCVCNTTLASTAVVSSSASAQAQTYAVPSCVSDVFARTGIRWYVDGPILQGVTYWRKPAAEAYASGRAAQRLMALGYRCERVQLYDAADTSFY